MAFSQDVLTTALQRLLPGYTETFTTWHPLFDAVVKGKSREKVDAPYLEFVLTPGGPGVMTPMPTGNELIQSARRQESKRASALCSTIYYSFPVRLQDLRDANGKADIAKLFQSGPERSLMDMHETLAEQLAVGGTEGASNFITFNSDATYDPRGLGARTGIFSFEAASAQTDTVWGVQKNSITGWHNQYANITSFNSEGREKMRECYWDCEEQGSAGMGAPDLGFADRRTYANYVKDLDDQVQIVDRSTEAGDRAPTRYRSGIKFLGATIYAERRLKESAFSDTNAQAGVLYLINSGTWKQIYQGGPNGATDGNFAMEGPVRIPDRAAIKYEFVFNGGLYCPDLRCNGVVTGGGRA